MLNVASNFFYNNLRFSLYIFLKIIWQFSFFHNLPHICGNIFRYGTERNKFEKPKIHTGSSRFTRNHETKRKQISRLNHLSELSWWSARSLKRDDPESTRVRGGGEKKKQEWKTKLKQFANTENKIAPPVPFIHKDYFSISKSRYGFFEDDLLVVDLSEITRGSD